ncbi:hypothetical protein HBN50_15485 [Halobacteriovorax sp. GB3]|uniref:hypothetical protein n=1 Tax=Halobacteriovorax sp. GB3 TaxID=2719615 RepID=UPI00235EF400|nr:hypothetical protein [Halobacteriovorax sp. GB3]MDD0854513.1 hypothetical protein [Halobacteriovorax sp. GB3]
MEEQKTSSVVDSKTVPIKDGQPEFQTWWIIGFLVVALIILKTFIYIKDEKRDGK